MLRWGPCEESSTLSPASRLKFGKWIYPEVRSKTDECDACEKEVPLVGTRQKDIRSV